MKKRDEIKLITKIIFIIFLILLSIVIIKNTSKNLTGKSIINPNLKESFSEIQNSPIIMNMLDYSDWNITSSKKDLSKLTDNNLKTTVNLQKEIVKIDTRKLNVFNRIYIKYSSKKYANITISIGENENLAKNIYNYTAKPECDKNRNQETLPCSNFNSSNAEADIKFKPTQGRYILLNFTDYFNVSEIEIYGWNNTNFFNSQDAVVLDIDNQTIQRPLMYIADELSYYLTLLTGKYVPVISSSQANSYSGNLYIIKDLRYYAKNYSHMQKNVDLGIIPNENETFRVLYDGKNITFIAFPYQKVFHAVYDFLDRQGVKWPYPDAGHPDYVPVNQGINYSILPYNYTASNTDIYANFPAGDFSWSNNAYTYFWRNHWSRTWGGGFEIYGWNNNKLKFNLQPAYGINGELPLRPDITNITPEFQCGFLGTFHNFGNLFRRGPYCNGSSGHLTTDHPAWQGIDDNGNKQTWLPELWHPELIQKIADKAIAWQTATSKIGTGTRQWGESRGDVRQIDNFWLAPWDDYKFSKSNESLEIIKPFEETIYPHQKENASFSNLYYYFVNEVAKKVKLKIPDAQISALAYQDRLNPPRNIEKFSDNVHIKICLFSSWFNTLPITNYKNSNMRYALESFRNKTEKLSYYGYYLLNERLENKKLIIPLIKTLKADYGYLYSMGIREGDTQANIEIIPYNPWNFYAFSQINWDVSKSEEKIKQDFFSSYYGESSQEMLAFYNTFEEHIMSNNITLGNPSGYPIAIGAFPIEILKQMDIYLTKAETSAKYWVVKERVAKSRESMDWILSQKRLNRTTLYEDNFPKANLTSSLFVNASWIPNKYPLGIYNNMLLSFFVNVTESGRYIITASLRPIEKNSQKRYIQFYVDNLENNKSFYVKGTDYYSINYNYPASFDIEAGIHEIYFGNQLDAKIYPTRPTEVWHFTISPYNSTIENKQPLSTIFAENNTLLKEITTPTTINADEMRIRTSGGYSKEGYLLDSKGIIGDYFFFSQQGNYLISINASSEGNSRIGLQINNKKYGPFNTNNEIIANVNVEKGINKIAVEDLDNLHDILIRSFSIFPSNNQESNMISSSNEKLIQHTSIEKPIIIDLTKFENANIRNSDSKKNSTNGWLLYAVQKDFAGNYIYIKNNGRYNLTIETKMRTRDFSKGFPKMSINLGNNKSQVFLDLINPDTKNYYNYTFQIPAEKGLNEIYVSGTENKTLAWNDVYIKSISISTIEEYPEEYCGNGICNLSINENCSSCSQDCGNCQIVPIKDLIPPLVTITNPSNNRNYNSTTTSIVLNVATNENATCLFSNNFTISSMNSNSSNTGFNATLQVSSGINYSVFVYCNDTSNNLNQTSVYFSINANSNESLIKNNTSYNTNSGKVGSSGGASLNQRNLTQTNPSIINNYQNQMQQATQKENSSITKENNKEQANLEEDNKERTNNSFLSIYYVIIAIIILTILIIILAIFIMHRKNSNQEASPSL